MTVEEIKIEILQINDLLLKNRKANANKRFIVLLNRLFELKKYKDIVSLYENFDKRLDLNKFEIAYSLKELNYVQVSEKIYESLLKEEPDNLAYLNNLAVIKKENKNIKEAFSLISMASEIDDNDEIIQKNLVDITSLINEEKEKTRVFKESLIHIRNENEFVKTKLKKFLESIKKESSFNENKVSIPNWRFKIFMETDEVKANSLKEQWIKKDYIKNTGERDNNRCVIYEINPFILNELNKIEDTKLNKEWIMGIESINNQTLEKLSYFTTKLKLKKMKAKFRNIVIRDYDELIINYLFGNNKTTIVLSGSLIESLLIYYCEKNKIEKIDYALSNKTICKGLYEADLVDLLNYCEQNKYFSKQIVHLGNVARLFRNFIHPGKELRNEEILDRAKAEICFISVHEIIKEII